MRKNLFVSMFIMLTAVLVLSACGPAATPQTVVQTKLWKSLLLRVCCTCHPHAPHRLAPSRSPRQARLSHCLSTPSGRMLPVMLILRGLSIQVSVRCRQDRHHQ